MAWLSMGHAWASAIQNEISHALPGEGGRPARLAGLTVSDLDCLKSNAIEVLCIHRIATIIIGLGNALIEVAYMSPQALFI